MNYNSKDKAVDILKGKNESLFPGLKKIFDTYSECGI
jgi:hypothetical protein